MLSTLTIISIFTEIFAAGMLLAGAYTFIQRFILERNAKDLYLALTFITFALYVALTVISQMMFNLGRPLSELIILQKFLAADLILGAFVLYLFARERFGFKARWLTYLLLLGLIVILFLIFFSTLSLSFRPDVIEPVVKFSYLIPIRSLWRLIWAVLGGTYFYQSFKTKALGEKNILRLTAYSAFLVFAADVGTYIYSELTGEAGYLLVSWVLTLLAATGFFLGNIIPPESEIARAPLNYFRTKLLYKLILIFVLLIVILLETTTLATINISKVSLAKSVISTHTESASKLVDKIDYYISNALEAMGLIATPEYVLSPQGKTLLRLLLDTNPIFDALAVIDAKGKTSLLTLRSVKTPLPPLRVNEIFAELGKKGVFISKVEQAPDKNFYILTAVRIKGSSQVLISRINLKVVQSLIERGEVGKHGWAYAVDEEGRLFAHPDQKRATVREDFSDISAVAKVISGLSGGEEFYDKEGNKMVGAYVPFKTLKGGIVVQEQLAEAYFELRRVETNSLIFVIAGIILTVFTGIFFARGIEKSILEVIAGTEAVRKGDLTRRIKVDTIDEVGQLADAFNQMTAELKESQDHLVASEKLAALGTMAAGMAHEIKNPLVSLRTFTQLLPTRFDDEEFRKKFISVIPSEIDRINKIAENLLRFGRPAKPELKETNVNTVLEEVLGLFEGECKKFNIRVTTKFAELPSIIADAGMLSQAFVNIVLNAIQAMPKGGELTIKTDVGEVTKLGPIPRRGRLREEGLIREISWGEREEEAAKPTPVVFVEITDTGEGIPEEAMGKLFDPFFSTKVGGTGMGLPITLRIVEEHKGSIKVRSQAGKGTTFIITLPQKPA